MNCGRSGSVSPHTLWVIEPTVADPCSPHNQKSPMWRQSPVLRDPLNLAPNSRSWVKPLISVTNEFLLCGLPSPTCTGLVRFVPPSSPHEVQSHLSRTIMMTLHRSERSVLRLSLCACQFPKLVCSKRSNRSAQDL
jgi:hypothetical protein